MKWSQHHILHHESNSKNTLIDSWKLNNTVISRNLTIHQNWRLYVDIRSNYTKGQCINRTDLGSYQLIWDLWNQMWWKQIEKGKWKDIRSSSWSSSFFTNGCAIADLLRSRFKRFAQISFVSISRCNGPNARRGREYWDSELGSREQMAKGVRENWKF